LQVQLAQGRGVVRRVPHLEQPRLEGADPGRRQAGVDDRDERNRQRRGLGDRLELAGERQARQRGCLRLVKQRHHMLSGGNSSQGAQRLCGRLNGELRRQRPRAERRVAHERRGVAGDAEQGITGQGWRSADRTGFRHQRPALRGSSANDVRLRNRCQVQFGPMLNVKGVRNERERRIGSAKFGDPTLFRRIVDGRQTSRRPAGARGRGGGKLLDKRLRVPRCAGVTGGAEHQCHNRRRQ
jgi:hypothetical protein